MMPSDIYSERLEYYQNWSKQAEQLHLAKLDKRYAKIQMRYLQSGMLQEALPDLRTRPLVLQMSLLVLILSIVVTFSA